MRNGQPLVQVVRFSDGTVLHGYAPFEGSNGISVATGAVNGDGVPDTIVGAGPNGGPRVTVFDGSTDAVLRNFFAFETTFTGGVQVSSGDLNGDGLGDVLVGVAAVRIYLSCGNGPIAAARTCTGWPRCVSRQAMSTAAFNCCSTRAMSARSTSPGCVWLRATGPSGTMSGIWRSSSASGPDSKSRRSVKSAGNHTSPAWRDISGRIAVDVLVQLTAALAALLILGHREEEPDDRLR